MIINKNDIKNKLYKKSIKNIKIIQKNNLIIKIKTN